MDSPPNDLDAQALGRSAPAKGLARRACPYAAGTVARERWLAGYDEALAAGVEPARGGTAEGPGEDRSR